MVGCHFPVCRAGNVSCLRREWRTRAGAHAMNKASLAEQGSGKKRRHSCSRDMDIAVDEPAVEVEVGSEAAAAHGPGSGF